ncbi:TenA family transcriptional regulator [Chitinimonas naiadis]
MNFFERLQTETAAERGYLLSAPAILDCQRAIVPRERYVAFLTEAYHHVKHTVPLLMAVGSRLRPDQRWLFDAIVEYIDEEKGHDEWILGDIAACGVDAEAVRLGRPHLSTELMVSYAWDSVSRINPVSFFGMVYVLEGTSVSLATPMAGIIQQTLGLPPQALTYLTSHGSLDQEHIGFFERLMNRLEDTRDQEAVLHMARTMFVLYGNVFRSLTEREQGATA